MTKLLLTGLLGAVLSLSLGQRQSVASGNEVDGFSLASNQTFGFGQNYLLRFTYGQSFACVDEPADDRNYNGVLAKSDPAEYQTPICQIGAPSILAPPGGLRKDVAPLWVLVPMFSLNNDKNPDDAFSPELGKTLIALFGAVPEGFKKQPLVDVQCPDPHNSPGTCTMHASQLDLFPVLSALGKIPAEPKQNIFVPTPNHDHLIHAQDINDPEIWWQVITVLVTDPQDWPNKEGTSGITSFNKLRAAEAAGTAIETTSNFFLFFGSKALVHVH
jgi:hypothetical protein